jgi:hypothetical protein
MKSTISVSDLFFKIYINFNVFAQIEEMKELSRKELLLLLLITLENYEVDDIVLGNFLAFEDELLKINNHFFDVKDDDDVDLMELENIAPLTLIDFDNITDKDGNNLPTPTPKNEAIQIRRSRILDDLLNDKNTKK